MFFESILDQAMVNFTSRYHGTDLKTLIRQYLHDGLEFTGDLFKRFDFFDRNSQGNDSRGSNDLIFPARETWKHTAT